MNRLKIILHSALHLMVLALLILGSGLVLHADPLEATIISPSGAITAATNQPVGFSATSDDSVGWDSYVVNSYTWSFGDGNVGSGASTSHAYTTAGTYTLTLTVSYTGKTCSRMDVNGNCTGWIGGVPKTATATRTITVVPPPSITSFIASKTSVEARSPVTLSWGTANATSLSITNVGTVTGTTSVVVYPSATTMYTLTATGVGPAATSSVTVGTYTILVGISPGSQTVPFGGSQVFTGTVSPANQGVSWTTTGGGLGTGSGSGGTYTNTFTGTVSGGPYTVTVASVEDPTRTASASVTVQTVSVATPVPVPANGQTFVGGTVSFSALVSGAVNSGVNWSVNGGGSIDASGVFTASQQGSWVVTATSQADTTKNSTAPVYVKPLTVILTPDAVTVRSGQIQQFTAVVAGPGTPSQAVTWSVVNANGGTITSAGVYTAPSMPGDYTVKATSVQDSTCVGTASVHVPGWVLKWKKDILYAGIKEVAEIDAAGIHVTMVDHLGSPRFLAGPTGVIESTQKYMPFGESLADPVSAAKFAKGFTNHEQTDPSGLIYMQARFYAPWYGRFLSPDPARDQHFEETQSWNIYSYCQNNPTMAIDPDGMKIEFPKNTTPEARKQWDAAVKYLQKSPTAKAAYDAVENSPKVTKIFIGEDQADQSTGGKIGWNPTGGLALKDDNGNLTGEIQSPAMQAIHELGHRAEELANRDAYDKNAEPTGGKYDSKEEERNGKKVETPAAKELGEPTRTNHKGDMVRVKGPTSRTPVRRAPEPPKKEKKVEEKK